MWFLHGLPNSIHTDIVVTSLPNGYQHTTLRFKVTRDEDDTASVLHNKYWIAIPFPWATNKDFGGFQLDQKFIINAIKGTFDDSYESITYIKEDDVEIYEKSRSLLTKDHVNPLIIGDMKDWYVQDDYGFVTFWIEGNQWYHIEYTHKISISTRLFVPTKLPTLVLMKKPEYVVNMWVINAYKYGIPKCVERVDFDFNENIKDLLPDCCETIDAYTLKKDWEPEWDLEFDTDNWESSDDANSDSDDN